jgi:hypothetical protein
MPPHSRLQQTHKIRTHVYTSDVDPLFKVMWIPIKLGHIFTQVMWIRTGFNADPDPAFYEFYLNANADPATREPMLIHEDPDPGQKKLIIT